MLVRALDLNFWLASMQGWLGLVCVGVWLCLALQAQYQKWFKTAKYWYEQVLFSVVGSFTVFVFTVIIWTQYRVSLFAIFNQFINVGSVIIHLFTPLLGHVAQQNCVVWILLVGLVTTLIGRRRFTNVILLLLGAAPGNSSETKVHTTEEETNNVAINIAGLRPLTQALKDLLGSNSAERIPKVQNDTDNLMTCLEAMFQKYSDTNKKTETMSEHLSNYNELKTEMNHLKMLLFARDRPMASMQVKEANNQEEKRENKTEEEALSWKIAEVQAIQSKEHAEKTTTQTKNPPLKEIADSEVSEVLEELKKQYDGDIDKLLSLVNRKRREEKSANQLPEYLTPEERQLGKQDLAQLDREWKNITGREIRASDYLSIGVLDTTQVQQPRKLIQEIISIRRRNAYFERMIKEGKQVSECENCNRKIVNGQNHHCIATSWKFATRKRGVPAEHRVIVSQSNRGNIQIAKPLQVNEKKLCQELDKMRSHQLLAAERKNYSTEKTSGNTEVIEEKEVFIPLESQQNNEDELMAINTVLAPSLSSAIMRRNFQSELTETAYR